MSKLVLSQPRLYQDYGALAIWQPTPQDNVNSCSVFFGARAFTVDLAKQMPRGRPFKDDSVNSQLIPQPDR